MQGAHLVGEVGVRPGDGDDILAVLTLGGLYRMIIRKSDMDALDKPRLRRRRLRRKLTVRKDII